MGRPGLMLSGIAVGRPGLLLCYAMWMAEGGVVRPSWMLCCWSIYLGEMGISYVSSFVVELVRD